ncbi:CBS domain-containing protein [Nitrincola schmidtii]|uniref:CBS domain-containing protein n=1 Tax=Nitrincola schmidtii TaxID=1730894 RepID=UPI00124DF510|nr:CBS domain-containing protein [Nitrincola schmidtii]
MSNHINKVVADVMNQNFRMIDGLVTVSDAVKLMKQTRSQVLIVEKRDSSDEFGLVLLSDIAKKVLARNLSPERVNVYEIMSKPALTVKAQMQIRFCARLFNKFGLTMAPVVNKDDEIIGVINYDDLVLSGLSSL